MQDFSNCTSGVVWPKSLWFFSPSLPLNSFMGKISVLLRMLSHFSSYFHTKLKKLGSSLHSSTPRPVPWRHPKVEQACVLLPQPIWTSIFSAIALLTPPVCTSSPTLFPLFGTQAFQDKDKDCCFLGVLQHFAKRYLIS